MRNVFATIATLGLVLSTACSTTNSSAPDPVAAPGTSASLTNDHGSTPGMAATSAPAETYTFPIEWTLTRVECPALWADWVTGTGTEHKIIRIVPSSDGVSQITAVNTASGTAVDSAGRRLQFAYTNAFHLLNIDGDGPTFQRTETDSFNLVGPGGKTFRVSVGFVSQYKVDAGGSLVFDKLTARGDMGCQPIQPI